MVGGVLSCCATPGAVFFLCASLSSSLDESGSFPLEVYNYFNSLAITERNGHAFDNFFVQSSLPVLCYNCLEQPFSPSELFCLTQKQCKKSIQILTYYDCMDCMD